VSATTPNAVILGIFTPDTNVTTPLNYKHLLSWPISPTFLRVRPGSTTVKLKWIVGAEMFIG